MARHGYALTFGLLLAEAIGLPFPRARSGGGGSCGRGSCAVGAVCLAGSDHRVAAGDTVQFWLDATWLGAAGFLCRVSINPETCILRSAESFYKRAKSRW